MPLKSVRGVDPVPRRFNIEIGPGHHRNGGGYRARGAGDQHRRGVLLVVAATPKIRPKMETVPFSIPNTTVPAELASELRSRRNVATIVIVGGPPSGDCRREFTYYLQNDIDIRPGESGDATAIARLCRHPQQGFGGSGGLRHPFLGMQLFDKSKNSLALRMDDRKQRVVIQADESEGPSFDGWEVADATTLDALAARLETSGVQVARGSRALADERRVEDLIVFADPVGTRLEAFYGAEVVDVVGYPLCLIHGTMGALMRDLNDLYFFAQVVEYQGFAPAGRALGMPKSTLSRRIAVLKEHLGVRLIQRSTRRFTVTEIGQSYYTHCKAMLSRRKRRNRRSI